MQATTERISKNASERYAGAEGERTFAAWRLGMGLSLRRALEEEASGRRVFRADSKGIFEFFLEQFDDAADRQYHNCHCCALFLRRYGSLVTLERDGCVRPVLWDLGALRSDVVRAYGHITLALQRWVEQREVVDQFFWKDREWGSEQAGGFSHLHVRVPRGEGATAFGEPDAGLTVGQSMALRRQERRHLEAALAVDLLPEYVSRAVALLEAGSLARAEKLLPMGKFLEGVHADLSGVKDSRRRNRILWAAVGRAARGWCTPRGSAFGALVADVRDGKELRELVRAHDARLAPDQYQRPQAPPSAGNLEAAEKLFAELGLGPSLERRFLALEEAELFWAPERGRSSSPLSASGVFSHLALKPASDREVPLTAKPQCMTFAKFERDVLPKALRMKVFPPTHGAYSALATAVHSDAPPILQWDRLDRRNPVSWYLWTGGSSASSWGLSAHVPANVEGLCRLPPDWFGSTGFQHQTAGRVMILIAGCQDSRSPSLALFPEFLKSELHSVRATLEAHARSRTLERLPEGSRYASGLMLGAGDLSVTLQVVTADGVVLCLLDRLE